MKELTLFEKRKFAADTDGNGSREVSRISSIRVAVEMGNPFANNSGKEEGRNRRGESVFRFVLNRQRELRIRTERRQ
ncbi:MAG: hypothetical protein PHG91_02235 [Syntrophales bacterium]|nr:hypothetical protein [Syntrophales bacterium]MDD5232190.1 hypothetical protein [Syntrophales bacterium]MDD5532851.1 hypothetical protein [Syntrophales bacterium]HPL62439.1 hypothetical protein [Syntrophales bacterium]